MLDATNRLRPDLIVVDVVMPVLNGIEALAAQSGNRLPLAVVFISTDVGDESVQRALETGALAFVRKAFATEDLLPAAHAALIGQRFISKRV